MATSDRAPYRLDIGDQAGAVASRFRRGLGVLRWLGIVLIGGGGFVFVAPRVVHGLTIFSEFGLVAPAIAAAALLIGVFLVWSSGLD